MEELNIDSISPNFRSSHRLGDDVFQFAFQWSERRKRWTVDVLNDAGGPLLLGRTIVAGRALFVRSRGEALPRGDVFVVELSGSGEPPGRYDLGDRVRLVFVPEVAQ